jgi:uncharacterized membrane protein YgdD (TMEM256/DUF423 family)
MLPDESRKAVRLFVRIAAVNGFLAVALGAFGAHVLKDKLTANYMAVYDTGARYHLTHAVALLAVALLTSVLGDSKVLRASGWLFTVGMVLFSGSLYALAITGITMLGAITPIGGLCLLAGWACLAVAGGSGRPVNTSN